MTTDKLNEKARRRFAEMEGYAIGEISIGGARYQYSKNGEGKNCIPKYDNETGLLPIVRLLDDEQFDTYSACLWQECGFPFDRTKLVIATADQMYAALIQTLGITEDSE